MLLLSDALFYWTHRAMHESKWLYRHIHKVHHEFKGSLSIAAEYAHPVEQVSRVASFTCQPRSPHADRPRG